jgi:hypothetical protein
MQGDLKTLATTKVEKAFKTFHIFLGLWHYNFYKHLCKPSLLQTTWLDKIKA